MKAISLRAYARHRRCTLSTVQEAIAGGRLATSLTPDGKIRSAKAADREWAATTLEDRRPITGPAAAKHETSGSSTLQEARTRREIAEAGLSELELARERGELVLACEVEATLVRYISNCKVHLRAIPNRLGSRLDRDECLRVTPMVAEMIDEALEELAAGTALDKKK